MSSEISNLTVLQNKSLLLLMTSRVANTLAFQMLTVAVGWQMYSLTQSAFYLGLVGLIQFLPMILLTLVVGHVADRWDRKLIIFSSQLVEAAAVLSLAFGCYHGWINKESILFIIFCIGAANSFQGPPMQALLPNVVEEEVFPRAAALVASTSQFAVIIGPGLGGILYALGPGVVYSLTGTLIFISSILILFISVRKEQVKTESKSLKTLFAGISFIKSRPVILGAISLDLFAVLFGGATALLPIYASKILNIGSFGLGILRSAPAVGALLMSAILARYPLKKNVGRTMFTAVIFFGLATVLFSLSTSYLLSILALFILGASDVISVVIRSTFVQMETPDTMRGRVSSVNMLFIGTSNQLGEFESGLTASWFGAVPAVLIGGIGTIVVAFLWMKLFPDLLHIDKLEFRKSS
ncbi:MFS transporter [Desulfosporosinus sp. PR]|uniref:MFS transporter n=1 Tax=Candidatus Desulfosporosinus nitrosoreducens TaxID=3401928 RepID=UPI0027E7CF46|nr:MFS transporter [Desulfosporosinus sp. PR]MDQ7097036.1 MFS transporter [Desulfosporosinus sp. PR]